MPPAPKSVLISAGEASGDYYASLLLHELRRRWPETDFFGCAGASLRRENLRAVIHAEDLAVVGIFEVLAHIPRIWRRFRELIAAARTTRPTLAILTDAPDFHFRVARKLKRLGIPVVYLVAPQVWAWREGRVKTMRRIIDRLLCIFPFEEPFFRERRVPTTYIGHPLAGRVRPTLSREDFFRKHNLPLNRPLVVVLPGSRPSEVLRHIPPLTEAAARLSATRELSFILPASPHCGTAFFEPHLAGSPIKSIPGEAWDALAHCDLALAASGTVTVEATLLNAPMVTYYRVTPLTWAIGRHLVNIPFYSMPNLIAGRQIIPELIQDDMTGERVAAAAAPLLDDAVYRAKMKEDLSAVAARLTTSGDAIQAAADAVQQLFEASGQTGRKQ